MNKTQLIGVGKFLAELKNSITNLGEELAKINLDFLRIQQEIEKFTKWVEKVDINGDNKVCSV